MVAQNMLPDNPAIRDFVTTTLQEHPSIERFLNRLQHHVQETYVNATIKIRRLAFDEWDPPLIVEITADIPREILVDELHALRDWCGKDPDFNRALITLSLLPRLSAAGSAR